MEEFDLVVALVSLGVEESAAEDLKARLLGEDLVNLVNALNTNDLAFGMTQATPILRKYGVSIVGEKSVDDYKRAQMESLKDGKLFAVESFINEWLHPLNLDEDSSGLLVAEGFNYTLETTDQSRDKVLDWLDENQIEYQANTPSVFHVKCEDRASAYRISRALSEIMSRPVVRDSRISSGPDSDTAFEQTEDHYMAEKSSKQRIAAAQKKLDNFKTRTPTVMNQTGAGVHKGGDNKKKDDTGRDAKHKGKRFEEGYEFSIGENVLVGERQGTIEIPYGPNGTIGVVMDGELAMVAECEVGRLDEGVIGMSNMKHISRLRELAGLPMPKNMSSDLGPLSAGPVDVADPIDDPMADLGMDMPADDMSSDMDVSMDVPGNDMPGNDMPGNEFSEPEMGGDEFGDELGVDPMMDIPPTAGIPGDLPPIAAEPALGVGMPMQSEAMSTIEDSLNSIQTKLSDIRLGEYKTLIQKLQDLTTQVSNMGRDYLGERRRK